METQTVEKSKGSLSATLFLHGKRFNLQTMKGENFIRISIGQYPTEVELFFDDESAFKAFVGEMIKAVANLK